MDLKDFAKSNLHNQEETKKEEKTMEQTQAEYGDLVNEFVKRYGNMEEEQLMSEMFKLIQQKKQEGTFDANQIRKAAEQVAPLLTDEQRAKMYSLLNYLD
ncbi:MAG: hypothetical protein IJZ26_03610 [Clostridia bacterium]|nr:hypothetical protein [Clostridia bacterium]